MSVANRREISREDGGEVVTVHVPFSQTLRVPRGLIEVTDPGLSGLLDRTAQSGWFGVSVVRGLDVDR
jgi:hypothetical protein